MKAHFKNALACALTVFLFALILGGIGLKTALAATDVWDGSTASAFASGEGTSANPYQIATGAQLAYLASVVNGEANGVPSLGKYYILTADIDLDHWPWTPIATTYFRGTFDGDGHVITNLSIGTAAVPDTSGKSLGLFGTIAGGTVKNLGIENIAIYASATSRTGGVAGSFSSWGTTLTPSTIFNCYTSGVIVNSRAGASAYVGGLAGYCTGAGADDSLRNLIINCGTTVNVTASGTATSVRVGGLIGSTALANIRNCYATGDVISGNVDKAGGLIGDNQSANVTNCYWNSDAQQIISTSTNQVPKLGIGSLFSGLTDTTTSKTALQMKDSAFVTLLNNNRESYAMWGFVSGANNGYPVLLLSAPVISLAPSGNKTFSPQVVGYSALTPYSVTINNTGAGETGALTIALSGTYASSFALSASSITTIAASASSSFTVVPKTGLPEGTYNATVSVSGDAVTTQTFNVSFTVQAATYTVSASPDSLAFGSKIDGYAAAPAAQTVTITNDGNSTVTLTTPTNTNYSIMALDALTLAPAATARFDVQPKTGLAVGTYDETLTFSTTSSTSDTVAVSFTVSAATYTVSASPTSLSFGSVIEGYTSAPVAQTVTITNDGNSAVTLTLPTVTGYTLGALSDATLASGESATFTAQPVTGLGVGTHNETITVSTDHLTSVDVGVSFTVSAATYTVSASPTSMSFGSVIEGYTSAPIAQTVTITNDGNSAVTLSLPTVTGYTLGVLSDATLASGESATFTAQPVIGLGVGTHNETITVSTDHLTSVDVGVSFTVSAATYTVSASPTSLAFGSVIEGYTSAPIAQTVTITNDGNSAVTLSLPTVTGYTLGALSDATLASGESATFTAQPVTGLGVGTHNETITVSTDHLTSVDVGVSFTVSAATYTVSASPTSLSFGSVIEGYTSAPVAQTVTITNDGNSAVTLNLPTVTGYTLGALSDATLASGESATFTAQPVTGLGVGTHNETITVSTDHSTSVDVGVSFTVSAATYTVSASPTSLSFGSVIEGYTSAPVAQTVTITNDGNSAVTLNLPTVTGYTLGALSDATLASGESATFTAQPVTGLGVGTHNETITVSTDHSTSADIGVSFTVQSASYVVEASTDSLAFGSMVEGYASSPTSQAVTITNKGNKNVTLITPVSVTYDISTSDSLTVAPDGTVQFSVRPKAALGVGNHNETIVFSTTNSTSDSIDVSFTVQSASYAISVTPLTKTFLSTTEGMAPPAGETFTVTNDGNIPVTLTQPTATNYIIGTLSAFSIDPMETATFTVAPKAGLTVGSYTETITTQGSNSTSAQAEVRFIVTEALSYAIGATPASITFDNLAEGYLPPDAKTVTVTNTGNQSISLYQPTASRYTIGTLSVTSLAPASTATFSVTPKDGLAAGTWNETIHILGSYGVNAQVDVAFTCTEPLDYAIISGNGSTYQQDDPNSPNITVIANGDLKKFTGLTLNGELVDESNYDVVEGSTIVTLHKNFLNTLTPGTYTLTIHYTDGQVEAYFVVHEQLPVTGDSDALLLFGTLIVLCLAGLILIRKRWYPGR